MRASADQIEPDSVYLPELGILHESQVYGHDS